MQLEMIMIVELRVYHCVTSRLPALLDRFSSSTLGLFEKHGIRQLGFWTTLVGPSNQTLTYMLHWQNLAERERKWGAFAADPEWAAQRAATEREGPLVERIENQLLMPTAFSALR